MAPGYNLPGRAPVTAVPDDIARLLVRHECLEEIRSRYVGLQLPAHSRIDAVADCR